MPTKNQSKVSPKARLDKAVKDYEKHHGPLSPEERQSVRETLRIGVLYPGEHVAFRDTLEEEGDFRRLVKRKVLYHSPDSKEVDKFMQELPTEKRASVRRGSMTIPQTTRER